MTIEKFFDLYEWRLGRNKPKISNLLKQRNQVYAHNDEATMKQDLDTTINSFPLNHEEIEELILFALDFCRFILVMLTNENRAIAPININDWRNTLDFARIGEKYRDIEVQQKIDSLKMD
ncbi:hypothetical protein ABG953_05915 [Enterococcus faecalis]|uniref:hypothetical protein n=1 Tax=Enterococcus faecalis TaxID=1351 RepID=UPI00325B5E95